MDQINRFSRPVVTGTPALTQNQNIQTQIQKEQDGASFISVLQKQLEAGSKAEFSKHAVNRVAQRQIDVSQQNLERLNKGMQLAQEKGLRDALILIDQDAYIVNAAQSRVITVNGDTLKGSVFTNIDGTVIV